MVALGKMQLTATEAPFRRQLAQRRSTDLSVEARRLDHSLMARRQPRLTLQVQDLSWDGLSATSRQPIAEGEHVSISFPRPSIGHAWDAFGRVVRCEAEGEGYQISVEFNPLPAA